MVAWGYRTVVSVLLLALLLCSAVRTYADDEQSPPTYTPGRILVKLRPGVAIQEVSDGKPIPRIGVTSVPVEEGKELETVQRLRQSPGVEFAEPDYIVRAFVEPNDPLFSFYQWNLKIIRADAAWDIDVGKDNVTVAVIDTGVDLSHPDLATKLVPGINMMYPGLPPQDDNGHGSHVAGIAAAASNNGTGVAGISWGAKILPVKVLDAFGMGSVADLAQGIIWAADHGARVMNISSGTPELSQTLEDAVNYAHDTKGILIVSSVGNDGGFGGFNPTYYPASFPNVVGVAATDSNDRRATFSERGPFVDVAAPGVSIVSCVLTGLGTPALGGDYEYLSGTSMSSPHVAGLAALIWSANTSLSNEQVARLIESTAVDLGLPGQDTFYGYGRIDAYAAARAATSGILSMSAGSAKFLTELNARQSTRVLNIANLGGVSFDWTATISPTVPWLTVTPASGRVGQLSTRPVTLTASLTGISSAGAYTTSVILNGQGDVQNSPVLLPVSLEVVDRLNGHYLPLVINSNVPGW